MENMQGLDRGLTLRDLPQDTIEAACFHALGLIDRNREYLEQHLCHMENPDPEVLDALADMAVASARLEHTLTELMSLLDCVRGQQPELKPLDLRAMVECIVRAARPVLRTAGAGITLHCSLPRESFCQAMANREYAEQICLRLLSNALRASRPGGEIWLELAAVPEGWQISVVDNGCGMNGLKDRELQLEQRRRFLGGAHAGLLLCREYSRLMGWELALRDRPEGGTQAVVTIPALCAEQLGGPTLELRGSEFYTSSCESARLQGLVVREMRTVPLMEGRATPKIES
ncbi:MAG: sensor histidine kinase [Faecalibacterium sp.]